MVQIITYAVAVIPAARESHFLFCFKSRWDACLRRHDGDLLTNFKICFAAPDNGALSLYQLHTAKNNSRNIFINHLHS